MASVTNFPDGRHQVTFKAPNGRRQTIRLGVVDKQHAENFKAKIERLLVYRKLNEVPDAVSIEWLAGLDDKLHDKLSRCGLIDQRGARTIGELVAFVTEKRCKPSTLVNIKNVGHCLSRFFGRERRLSDITVARADEFRLWLEKSGGARGQPLAPTTVSSICRRARGMFRVAASQRHRWIQSNPFDEQKDWVNTNPERDAYISPQEFDRVLVEIGEKEMRLLACLARYAGLRCPSEPMELEWTWLSVEHSTLFVRAPKTERYEGKANRMVPMSPRLMALFAELWQRAPEGAVKVFDSLRVSRAAIADRLEAACRRAGVVMWPKPFVNLRASCEHDWMQSHPVNVVTAWMGHSPDTMLRHYSRVVKEQSARHAASALQTKTDPKKRSAKRSAQNDSRRTPADDCEPFRA